MVRAAYARKLVISSSGSLILSDSRLYLSRLGLSLYWLPGQLESCDYLFDLFLINEFSLYNELNKRRIITRILQGDQPGHST